MAYTDELICQKLDRIIELLDGLCRRGYFEPAAAAGDSPASARGNQDLLLTTEQAAERLGMTKRFLESRRLRGDGPAFVKVSGKAVRYRQSALRTWTEAHTVMNTSQVLAAESKCGRFPT